MSLMNNSNPESGKVGRLLKLFPSQAFKVLLGPVTETVVQVIQSSASHEVPLAVSQSGYVPGGIVPSMLD